MNDAQVKAAARDLVAKLGAAHLPAANTLSAIASGVAVIAIADERGVITFDDDPTAATRLLRARNAAGAILAEHVVTLRSSGQTHTRIHALVEHLIGHLDPIRAASVET